MTLCCAMLCVSLHVWRFPPLAARPSGPAPRRATASCGSISPPMWGAGTPTSASGSSCCGTTGKCGNRQTACSATSRPSTTRTRPLRPSPTGPLSVPQVRHRTRGIQKVLKKNSKKYFICEISKLFFYILSIQFISVSDVSIEKFQNGIFW